MPKCKRKPTRKLSKTTDYENFLESTTASSSEDNKTKPKNLDLNSGIKLFERIESSDSEAQTDQSAEQLVINSIDIRSKAEKSLFTLVEQGKVEEVVAFIQANPEINVNQNDINGNTILMTAIDADDQDMVEALCNVSTMELNEAQLHAIRQSKYKSTKIIRNSIDARKASRMPKSVSGLSEEETKLPFIIAAQTGHYELLEFFYNKGERMPKFHFATCNCLECAKADTRDLEWAYARLEQIEAMISPAFIALMAGVDVEYDPVLEAFETNKMIERCIDEEPEFQEQYEELRDRLQKFVADLLGFCENSEDVKAFLKPKKGYHGVTCPYPRLMLAVDEKFKKFVSHPNAQEMLYMEWVGEPWITNSIGEKIFKKIIIYFQVLLFPLFSLFMCILLCCCYKMKMFNYLTSPKIRARSEIVSYIFYVAIIVYVATTPKGRSDVGAPPTYVTWIMAFYVLSHMVTFIREFLLNPRNYFTRGIAWYDLMVNVLWIASFALWGICALREKSNTKLILREQLHPLDPVILSECTFAYAALFTILRFTRFLLLHPALGPIQLAAAWMVRDILRFGAFIILIFLSFGLAFQYLYRNYKDNSIVNDDGEVEPQEKDFINLERAMGTMYFALFGMIDWHAKKVIPFTFNVPASEKDSDLEYVYNHHWSVEYTGTIFFICFQIIGVTLMLNMLTGVMSNSYSKVVDNLNEEWKFARSEIWLHYIRGNTLTHPFNLFPSGLAICDLCRWFQAVICSKRMEGKRASWTFYDCCHVEDLETKEEAKERKQVYPLLMKKLMQNYFRDSEIPDPTKPPEIKDLSKIKEDINQVRGTLDLLSNKGTEYMSSKRRNYMERMRRNSLPEHS